MVFFQRKLIDEKEKIYILPHLWIANGEYSL